MKTTRFISAAAVLLCLAFVEARANGTVSETGKSGMSFLAVSPTSRIASLGGLTSAYNTGASSLWSNPALISRQTERSAQFTHAEWIDGINQEFAAFATPTSIGALGLAVQLFDSGDIELRGDTPSTDPLGTYSIKNAAFSLTWARSLAKGVAVGIGYKKLFEKISDETAGGYAFDAGVLAETPVEGLTVAAAARNYGRMGKLKSERTKLPSDTSLGLKYLIGVPWLVRPVTTVADIVMPKYGDTGVRLGVELEPLDYLSCRLGYRSDSDIEDISFGIGLVMDRFSADLSYTPMDEGFDSALRFTLSITGF